MLGKRGQMKLSFGRIFSIILVIVFIAFAVYGITQFLSLKDSAQEGKFREDFESDLEKVWRSSEASTSHSYKLPSEFEEVCLKNAEENNGKNLFMKKEDSPFSDGYEVECGDGSDCLQVENPPQCTDLDNGEFSFTFKKSSGEAKVSVSTQ